MAAALPHVDAFVSGHSLARARRGHRGDRRTALTRRTPWSSRTRSSCRRRSTRSGTRCSTSSASRPACPAPQVLEQTGDDAYKVAVKVKLGPDVDDLQGRRRDRRARRRRAHEATMRAKAKEARGQGTADADDPHGAARAGRRDRGVDRHRHADERQGRGDGPGRDPRRRRLAHGHLREEPRRPRHGRRAGPRARGRRRRRGRGGAGRRAHAGRPRRLALPRRPPGRPPARRPPTPARACRSASSSGRCVAGRLQDPRARAVVAGLLALLVLRLGIAIGRRR